VTGTIKSGAVIFAKDTAGVARFYATLVPMTVLAEEEDAVRLENDAIQLVIHPLPPAHAKRVQIANPPEPRIDVPVKLVFAVESIAQIRAQAAALGGTMKPVSAEFVWAGFRACDGTDPEGNVIQFREPA
jgi:predicted enzyme related to lactoylglutathione lyase